MTYAQQSDMTARFDPSEVVALTDRSNAGVIDPVVLAGALAEADAEIEAYLAPRYPLPLNPVPRIITGLACDIARYRLCGGRVLATDEIRARYKDAVRLLEKISEGRVGLGVDVNGTSPPESSSVVLTATDPGRVFNDDSLLGY